MQLLGGRLTVSARREIRPVRKLRHYSVRYIPDHGVELPRQLRIVAGRRQWTVTWRWRRARDLFRGDLG